MVAGGGPLPRRPGAARAGGEKKEHRRARRAGEPAWGDQTGSAPTDGAQPYGGGTTPQGAMVFLFLFFSFFFFDVGRVDAGHDPEDARQARTTRSQQRPQRDGSTAVRVRRHRPPGTGLCSTAEARSPHERLGLPHASLLVHWTGMAINHPSGTCRKGARRRGTRTSYQVGRQF